MTQSTGVVHHMAWRARDDKWCTWVPLPAAAPASHRRPLAGAGAGAGWLGAARSLAAAAGAGGGCLLRRWLVAAAALRLATHPHHPDTPHPTPPRDTPRAVQLCQRIRPQVPHLAAPGMHRKVLPAGPCAGWHTGAPQRPWVGQRSGGKAQQLFWPMHGLAYRGVQHARAGMRCLLAHAGAGWHAQRPRPFPAAARRWTWQL